MAHSSGMRGLTNFIKEIRDCPNRAAEKQRVKLELAKFQTVFRSGSNMGSYQRKKYVCKLLYIFMLGYKVDIGRREAVQLCGAKKFHEKQVGYLAVGVLLHENHEMIDSLIEFLRRDLESTNFDFQGLAITTIANIGGSRLSRTFGEAIVNILMSQNSTTQLKKKASLCLLRILRQNDEIVTPEFMHLKLHQLLKMTHLGLLNSVIGLLMGMIDFDSDVAKYQEFLPRVLEILYQMVVSYSPSTKTSHYEYFGVPNPWLQVRLLQFLQKFPVPNDGSLRKQWIEIITDLLNESRPTIKDESSRYLTAKNSVLMEVFPLAAKLGSDAELKRSVFLLIEYMGSESATMRCIAVEKLLQMAKICPDISRFACHHYQSIFEFLNSDDRKRREQAAELLYLLCNPENTSAIIKEFLSRISRDSQLSAFYEEKITNICERVKDSHPDWYKNTMDQLFAVKGQRPPEPAPPSSPQQIRDEPQEPRHSVEISLEKPLMPQQNPFEPPDTPEFRSLFTSKRGVLLQSSFLQIGVIFELSAPTVSMTLYYGNLTQELLSDLNVAVNNPDMNALNFQAEAPPTQLQSQEQASQKVTITCTQEFIGVPQLNISFVQSGQMHMETAYLPVSVLSFITPFSVISADFLSAWSQINGPPQEQQLLWKTENTLDPQRYEQTLQNLQFALIDGVDPAPNNRVLACQFHTVAQNIPALCRIETDSKSEMFRITIKSYSPVLGASLAQQLKYFIN